VLLPGCNCERLDMTVMWGPERNNQTRVRSVGTPARCGRMIAQVMASHCSGIFMTLKQRNAARSEDPQAAEMKIHRREQSLDEALDASFPASDPPAAVAPHSSDR
jgi:hypothetical protein